MKRKGICPSYTAMYDQELYDLVSKLYEKDLLLYQEKCNSEFLLKRKDIIS